MQLRYFFWEVAVETAAAIADRKFDNFVALNPLLHDAPVWSKACM